MKVEVVITSQNIALATFVNALQEKKFYYNFENLNKY